jgi:hypothetical protein
MSTDDVLFEIQRSLGRIEARLDGQDLVLGDLKADLAAVQTKSLRRWTAVGKWLATVAATVVAAFVAFRLKVKG